MKKSEIFFGALRVPMDFLLTFLAFLTAYQIRSQTDLIPGVNFPVDLSTFMPLDRYIGLSLAAALLFIFVLAINRGYSLKITTTLSRELFQIFLTSLAWLAIVIAYFFFTRQVFFSRLVLGYSWLLTILFIILGRSIIQIIHLTLLKHGIGKRNILFIGINKITYRLSEELKENPRFRIVGAADTTMNEKNTPLPIIGTIENLKYLVKKHKIDEIIQTKQNMGPSEKHNFGNENAKIRAKTLNDDEAVSDEDTARRSEAFAAESLHLQSKGCFSEGPTCETEGKNILEFCREHHIQYSFVPDLMEVQLTNVELAQYKSIPLISLKPTSLDGWGKVMKRAFDLISAIILLMITSPLMILTAVAIALDSRGSIFFKYLDDGKIAKRVGEHGEYFFCYKFRTMRMNTHNLRYTSLADQNKRKGSPVVKIDNDPRITRVGKFLRKYSLDELPQLFNVITGNMSLVGPRPHLPEEVEHYKKHHKFVLTIKPGMTGMAQIHGRSDLDFEEEVKLDSYYIEHWSLWLDTKILLKTIFVVLKGKAE
ncbi:sugar transferase [Candidatus Peregrinibacteria bacterium]|nr:sugar transferase [Candidatus Peregrinibacteria bacterium]